MKIEEAIVYVLVKRNSGMTTDQIADAINRLALEKGRSACDEQTSVCDNLPIP